MILAKRGQFIESQFVFISKGQIYDPTERATPVDIYFSILRGENGTGPVVDGPFSYFREISSNSPNIEITRIGSGQFVFKYKVAPFLLEGTYTIFAQTKDNFGNISITSPFQIKGELPILSPIVISNNSATAVNYRATYDDLNRGNTDTVCLIGHADNIELNNPIKIRSIQSGIDLLGGDLRSPLLRGLFDAYHAGARDIFIMATAPLGEYAEKYQDRLISTKLFDLDSATPSDKTFYQKYYERLNETYSVLKQLDFIDYIVPLEASIIKTGGVDFVTQLAFHLAQFHNDTGFVQLGIIGSRSGGISSSDLNEFRSNLIFKNKFTQFKGTTTISSDIGRFIIPVYGEAVVQHSQLKTAYTSSAAASFAGMFASMPLNIGLIRTRIPSLMSLYGSDLTNAEIQELESLGINTLYRGRKTRRSAPFEVFATNEYTMAHPQSTLSKATQMRLIASVISQVKYLADQSIGRFGYDRAVDAVRGLLEEMKELQTIVDYSFNVEVNPRDRGRLIFHIELLSALGLKRIDFAVATGPEA